MYNLRSIFAICCSMLLFCQTIRAQEVWPGDVNNNGVVNGVDLLYWGVAFGSSGPARPQVSTDWQGVPTATGWGQSFSDGTSYAYADCDGSGLVDEEDFDDAIEDNFGLTHGPRLPDGYLTAQAGQAPRLRLSPDANQVNFGATVNITLSLDDSNMSLGDFYGMAASMSYTTDVLQGDDGIDFDFQEDNWIEADNAYVEEIFESDDQGKAQLAVSRTNQQNVQAQTGAIGSFSIVIEDIIVGRNVDTFQLTIDSVMVIDKDLGVIPFVADTVTIIISNEDNVTPVRDDRRSMDINIYPNPVDGNFYLEVEGGSAEPELLLLDQLGRTYPVRFQQLRPGRYRIERPPLPGGIYWLAVRAAAGWHGKKIILL